MKYSFKDLKDRNRHKNRRKRNGHARLVHVKDTNHTSSPLEGEQVGTTDRGKDVEMVGGAITGSNTSGSSVSCEKPKNTQILSPQEQELSRVCGQKLKKKKSLKPNCFLVWFSSTHGIGGRD